MDFFDALPDDIVVSIFRKLHDASSLSKSMAVCRRFCSLVPQVDEIHLSIPHKKTPQLESESEGRRRFFRNSMVRILMKPFSFISHIVKSRSKDEENENDLDFYSNYLNNEILQPFGEIKGLHLRLPCQKSRSGKSSAKNARVFLKWKAEFGRELRSCVILGAKSCSDMASGSKFESDGESRVMSDEDLKLRIVWTISCLIAAAARHYLVQETVVRRSAIENVVVSDESGQGRMRMNREQIEEMREAKGKEGDETARFEYTSRMPPLRMKMWYLERLELPGKVMEGATLVVIRPSGDTGSMDRDAVLGFGEEGEVEVLGDAIRKLMVAKKCYTLEMNSF